VFELEIKLTHDLTSQVYQDSLKIRQSVFVDEQGVPPELEIDDDETKAIYFVGYLNDQPVATARLLPDQDGFHIQRVAVVKDYRKLHLGQELLTALMTYAKNQKANHLSLNAQVEAVGFYQKNGYHLTEKPEFLDAGIRHREMRRTL